MNKDLNGEEREAERGKELGARCGKRVKWVGPHRKGGLREGEG